MRIALVCPYSLDVPGGVGTHVLGLARWLAGQGHDPYVIAPGTRQGEADVEVRPLGRSVPLPFNGSWARLALSPAQSRRAVRALEGADVVHVHEPLTPGIAFATARAAETLVVTHHAAYEIGGFLAGLLRRGATRLGPRRTIAVSRAAADTAGAVTGEAATIIPNGIALPDPAPRHRTQPPTVLFVGRRDDSRKGYPIFEHVARAMAGEARFVAVGPGRVVASEHVDVLPEVSDQELGQWLGRADAVVAPNLGGESFGLVLVEALAHGSGLVASDLHAFRRVVDDERVVTWFTSRDADGAVRAVREQLARGPDAVAARAVAGRFSWDVIGPRVLQEYALALG